MGKLNIELFKKVREKIATTPAAYDQETYGRRDREAPCGTAACIAGWACVLGDAATIEEVQSVQHKAASGDLELCERIPKQARTLLGLTTREANVLFTGDPSGYNEETDEYGDDDGWPAPFAESWEQASEEDKAHVAVAYLDHIIETGKVLE